MGMGSDVVDIGPNSKSTYQTLGSCAVEELSQKGPPDNRHIDVSRPVSAPHIMSDQIPPTASMTLGLLIPTQQPMRPSELPQVPSLEAHNVEYFSATNGIWIPAKVLSANADGTYHLD